MNLKLKKWNYPFIKSSDSNRSLMIDMMISLIPLYFMASWYYGVRALMLCFVSLFTAIVADTLCTVIAGKKINIRDYSAIVTGLILPLIMPANIPYYVLIFAVLFAILVVKHPFGGCGQNIFNPAAAGFAFATICWPKQIFSYPVPLEKLSLTSEVVVKLAENPVYSLKTDTLSQFDFADMLLGAFAGPMGATSILLIFACLLYLIFRKTINMITPVSFLATVTIIAFIFPRSGIPRFQSIGLELMSGMLLFCAVFVITDPTTSPKRWVSKAVYGCICALLTMFYRYFGFFQEGIVFAILFSNAIAPAIDYGVEYFLFKDMRRIKNVPKKSKKIT